MNELPIDAAKLERERSLTRALASERARLTRARKWSAVIVVIGATISIAEPTFAGASAVFAGLVVIPTFVRRSTIRQLERADDWAPGTSSVRVDGFWRGTTALAETRAGGRAPATTNVRRADGRYPAVGAVLDGYISRTQHVMITHDGRVYRLPTR